ncbi:MAG: mandelate racemase/muconate lactonizing enzyme family protein [Acidiferrobacterales bacterium]|nr:mandelate racemase/muconate lactonizing enzyme family protein [Acidiferrobacterales bacterium]
MTHIAEIHVYSKTLPVKNGPYTMAGQEVWELDTTIVQMVDQNGVSGWGEVCPLGTLYAPIHAGGLRSALELFAPAIIGAEVTPRNVVRILNQTLNGHNYARAILDIAVYDLLGKTLNVPVSTLLGGAIQDRVKSYYVLGLKPVESIVELARAKVDEGMRRLQIKIGRPDLAEDIEVIRKVYAEVGTTTSLIADGNRGLSGRDAIQLSQACRDIPITLEQPCDMIETNRSIRSQLCHPLFLDENILDVNMAADAIGQGIVDGFSMKISRLGGLSQFAVFRDLCAARGLPHTVDDGWGGNILAAATIHMASTVSPKYLEAAWLATPYQERGYSPDPLITIKNGYVDVPKGAGLGINPDPAQFGAPILSVG